MMTLKALIFSFVAIYLGCDGNSPISTRTSSITIDSISPSRAVSGDKMVIQGQGFSDTALVTVNGQFVEYKRVDKKTIELRVPEQTPGLTQITLEQDGQALTASYFHLKLVEDINVSKEDANDLTDIEIGLDGPRNVYPIVIGSAEDLCAGFKFYDEKGTLKEGTKDCNLTPPNCSESGQKDCVTSEEYFALSKSEFDAIAESESLPECNQDGAINCIANESYKAANISSIAPSDIRNNRTIAGVTGTAIIESHAECAADGAIGCISNASYRAADMSKVLATNIKQNISIAGVTGSVIPESHTNCLTDGAVGCISTTSYKAANMANVAPANIKHNVTIAGVTGNVIAESHSNCNSDGSTGCISTSTYKAADMSNVQSNNIKASVTIAGVTGTLVKESHSDCTSDGQVNCVASASYKASDMSNVLPANIRNSVTIAGVAGSAILESHSDCSSDGETGCISTNSFKAADMSNVLPANIKDSITIAGTTGNITAESHSNCTSDGETGCIATNSFKAADMSFVLPSNIKNSITIAGTTGNVTPESHSNCTLDGETSCIATSTYKAADMTFAISSNIKDTVTIAGVTGNATLESHSDCTSDGSTGCVTTSSYKSADMSSAVNGNIKSGVTIAGVVGTYTGGTPTISILNPTGNVISSGDDFNLTFVIDDKGTSGTTALYQKGTSGNCTDGSLTGWTQIDSGGLDEDTTSYTWSSPADGIYYVCGVYTTGSQSYYDLSPGRLNVGGAPGSCLSDDSDFVTNSSGCEQVSSSQIWSAERTSPALGSRNNGNSYCSGLSDGGQTWRLPTASELSSLATDGATDNLNITGSTYVYWSDTRDSGPNFFSVDISSGTNTSEHRNTDRKIICTTP